jgi:hypothetical protein
MRSIFKGKTDLSQIFAEEKEEEDKKKKILRNC